jgi:hypothetical protein
MDKLKLGQVETMTKIFARLKHWLDGPLWASFEDIGDGAVS